MGKLITDKYDIQILADDFAAAADQIIELFDNKTDDKPLKFKTKFKAMSDGMIGAYVDDSTSEDNRYGKFKTIEDVDVLRAEKLYDVNVELHSWDEDSATFKGVILITRDSTIVEQKSNEIPDKLIKLIEKRIRNGIHPELREILEARVKYMLDNYVNILDIEDVINYWSVDCINAWGTRIPTYYVDPALETCHQAGEGGFISNAIQTYLMGHPKILKGPKSTGKNTAINTIVWLFGDKVEEHTFTMQDSFADVISSEGTDNSASEKLKTIPTELLADAEKIRLRHTLDPSLSYTDEEDQVLLAEALFKQLSAESASVNIVHEYRAFARWLMDTTGHTCFVGDEMNMADANLLVGLLHPILDGSITEYDIPGRGPIPLANHLMLFATMNVGYAGEQEGNPATKSRFGAFELAQPESIKPILHAAVKHDLQKYKTVDLPEIYYNDAEKFYNACRSIAIGSNSSISDQCLNIRGIVRALVETARFNGRTTLREKIKAEVITPCDDEERMILIPVLTRTIKN